MADDMHGNTQNSSYGAQDAYAGMDAYAGAVSPGERTTVIPPLPTGFGSAPAIPVGSYPEGMVQDAAATGVANGMGTPGMDATVTVPVFQNAYMQPSGPEDFGMDGGALSGVSGAQIADEPRKRRIWPFVLLGLLAALIIALTGGYFGARSYYSHRAAPGISFGGQSVAGKDAGQLKDLVVSKTADTHMTLTDGKGGRAAASLKDLGVKVDADKTVSALLGAKSGSDFARINPFQRQSVPLSYSLDQVKMNDYLTKAFVSKDQQAVPSTIAFDDGSKTFTVQEGKKGRAPQMDSVKKAVNRSAEEPGGAQSVAISYHDVDMPITRDVATQAASEANKRLATPMAIDNGAGDQFTVPTDQVAQWIKPQTDFDKGTMALAYDQDAVKAYAATELPAKLNKNMVTEKNVKNTKGDVVAVTTKGVDGVKIKDTDATAAQIMNQLQTGQIAPIKAAADIEQHKEETRTARYDVPDGDMWVEVNLSTQTATAYKGTTPVKTFLICSGLPRNGDESDPGTFFINIRYDVQTMRGPGYVSPGVRWVSYYNGSEGFHTAAWNYDAIAHGDAANRGSHGCINMYEQDAKWIYDNCPAGTMVKVIGSQPTAPVR